MKAFNRRVAFVVAYSPASEQRFLGLESLSHPSYAHPVAVRLSIQPLTDMMIFEWSATKCTALPVTTGDRESSAVLIIFGMYQVFVTNYIKILPT